MPNAVPEIPDFRPFHVCTAPVIRQLIDDIDLIRRIDKLSPIKKARLQRRQALYKVEEFYEEQDVEFLLTRVSQRKT